MEKIRLRNSVMATEYEILPSPDFVRRKELEKLIEENDGICPYSTNKSTCMCDKFKEQNESGYCLGKRYYKVLKSPKVCLCGSTKFKDKFFEVARDLTLKGCIVTMPMVFVHSGDENISEIQKQYLDEVHKAKIAEADLIYIINVDGYIGNSTRSEINWATQLGKKIEYLES